MEWVRFPPTPDRGDLDRHSDGSPHVTVIGEEITSKHLTANRPATGNVRATLGSYHKWKMNPAHNWVYLGSYPRLPTIDNYERGLLWKKISEHVEVSHGCCTIHMTPAPYVFIENGRPLKNENED